MTLLGRRTLIGAAASLAGARALAQGVPSGRPRVSLASGDGQIVLEVALDKAPLTGANFLRYVESRRLDGSRFYRAMKLVPDPLNGLIQGGLGGLPRALFPPVAHEPTSQTGLRHLDGAVSLAREAPGSAHCDFFVCVGAIPGLDADPTQSGDNLGFAVFAQVVEGMDVVRRILLSPTSTTQGEGVMKGQILDPPVPILTARRL